MNNKEKIYIKAKDEIAAIVEKVLDADSDDLILVVPKTSHFARSVLNFQLLKRESDAMEKNIDIESDNADIQRIAGETGFGISGDKKGPSKTDAHVRSGRSISDILPPGAKNMQSEIDRKIEEARKSKKKNISLWGKDEEEEELDSVSEPEEAKILSLSVDEKDKGGGDEEEEADLKQEIEEEEDDEDDSTEELEKDKTGSKGVFINDDDGFSEDDDPGILSSGTDYGDDSDDDSGGRARRSIKKVAKLALVGVILVVVSGGVYVLASILPRAKVEIVMKEVNWEFNDVIYAQTKIADSSLEPPTVPLEIITLSKNTELDVPVTGVEQIEKRAKGTIAIYNEFSSDRQTLVATTRFLTPDGRLFRLDNSVRVPGAKIEDGKIIASSIDAAVTADKPGEEYNIGPVERFSIPGFKGSSRYNAFYGSSKGSMSGGFVGETAVVSQADIDEGKERIKELLNDALKNELELKIPDGFTTIEGMSESSVSELEFSHNLGEAADVLRVSGSVTLKTALFVEEDLLGLFTKATDKALEYESALRDYDLQYGVARVDYAGEEASFPVQYSAKLNRKADLEQLKTELLGKDKAETKSVIFALPGLESANVSFWPFWVSRVPKNIDRIKVEIR